MLPIEIIPVSDVSLTSTFYRYIVEKSLMSYIFFSSISPHGETLANISAIVLRRTLAYQVI